MYDVYEDKDYIYAALELCREQLFDRILSQLYISECNTAVVMKQLISGIAHCHSHRIAHRSVDLY